MKKSDTLQCLELAKKKLIDRGAIGISVFVREDATTEDIAEGMIEAISLMTVENTKSMI